MNSAMSYIDERCCARELWALTRDTFQIGTGTSVKYDGDNGGGGMPAITVDWEHERIMAFRARVVDGDLLVFSDTNGGRVELAVAEDERPGSLVLSAMRGRIVSSWQDDISDVLVERLASGRFYDRDWVPAVEETDPNGWWPADTITDRFFTLARTRQGRR